MSSSCRRTRTPLAAAALALIGGVGAAAQAGDIVLRIGGERGGFTAECVLKTGDGEESFTLDESLPFERTFAGNALRCRIEAASAFAVEVVKDGNRSRTRSSGGVVTVSVGS